MNLTWAKEWMDLLSRGKIEQQMEMYADDVHYESVPRGYKVNSKAKLLQGLSTFPTSGDHLFTVTAYTGNADGGAAEWTWQVKHAGDFMGVPTEGKETTVKGVSVLTFKDGKIASEYSYWDAATILRQLGALK